MIEQITIKNFKSIKELKLPCKKLNVFIGEPNSGKSNIIEALSLQSQNAITNVLNKNIFRYKLISDLFFDFNINNPIEVVTDQYTELRYALSENNVPLNQFHYRLDIYKHQKNPCTITFDGTIQTLGDTGKTSVHYYEYKRIEKFLQLYSPFLSVPNGENLPSLLLSNNEYKKWVSEFLLSKDLRLTLKPTENEIEFSKLVDQEFYSFKYFTLSETLQRIIFYSIALKSNKNIVILFDEPESNTFPFYTKYLAEIIALDTTNQFFITTHNPYLLLSLIEKSKKEDLNVCIVQMDDYKTISQTLTEKQITEVLDLNSDVFFNFEKILSL